jgi:hypothetical protein
MMDHRLALGLLTALLILAGAPLAYAWARLLPEEPEPFQAQGQGEGEPTMSPNWKRRSRGDPLAIFLTAVLTTSYVLKFPGMPIGRGLDLLGRAIPQPYVSWLVLAARWFFVVMPGLAAAYSAFRPNLFRISLIIGGVLVTALWLASPYLVAAIQR